MRGWQRLAVIPLVLLMLGSAECDGGESETGSVPEEAIDAYLRGSAEIEGGSIEHSIPEQPVMGDPWGVRALHRAPGRSAR